MTVETLQFEGGKYELRRSPESLCAFRHGEPWRDFSGDKLMSVMFDEILATRGSSVQLTALAVKDWSCTAGDLKPDTPVVAVSALQHLIAYSQDPPMHGPVTP